MLYFQLTISCIGFYSASFSTAFGELGAANTTASGFNIGGFRLNTNTAIGFNVGTLGAATMTAYGFGSSGLAGTGSFSAISSKVASYS